MHIDNFYKEKEQQYSFLSNRPEVIIDPDCKKTESYVQYIPIAESRLKRYEEEKQMKVYDDNNAIGLPEMLFPDVDFDTNEARYYETLNNQAEE